MQLITSSFTQPQSSITASSRSKPWILVILILALAGIFVLDRASADAPIQHLHYLPILLAALTFGAKGGVAAAGVAIVLYHLANKPVLEYHYGESDIVQVALFVAVGVIAAKLMDDATRLRVLAMTDDLTGLHNLRSFEERLVRMVRESRDAGTPISLLVLDVDELKSLNDAYGHLCGAEAVRTIGLIISENVPPDGVACRYGGDEFAIALPRCLPSQARKIADEIRRAVRARATVLAGTSYAPERFPSA